MKRNQNFRSLTSRAQSVHDSGKAYTTHKSRVKHKHINKYYSKEDQHSKDEISRSKPKWYVIPRTKSRQTTNNQLRRQTRERREYIHRKSLASQEQAIYQRKQQIKDLVAQGKQLPTELRRDAKEMGGRDLVLDEAQQGAS